MEESEVKIEFFSSKKVVVFGAPGVGKTSLTKRIDKGICPKDIPKDNGK